MKGGKGRERKKGRKRRKGRLKKERKERVPRKEQRSVGGGRGHLLRLGVAQKDVS